MINKSLLAASVVGGILGFTTVPNEFGKFPKDGVPTVDAVIPKNVDAPIPAGSQSTISVPPPNVSCPVNDKGARIVECVPDQNQTVSAQ
jgi:hypothetical protein